MCSSLGFVAGPKACRLRQVIGVKTVALLLLSTLPQVAQAQPEHRQMTQEEIEAWLERREVAGPQDVARPEDEPEAPPPPPRASGLVLESALGALGHLGSMKHVSPIAPLVDLKVGYEPLDFLMLFAQAELSFASTVYAQAPPEPRSYAFYGFGGGLRLTVRPLERLGLYLEGRVGMAEVSEDVLVVYGYDNADSLNPYFGGNLGVEWYQVNPHLALALTGGVRFYGESFRRQVSSQPALAWTGGLAIRYAFNL